MRRSMAVSAALLALLLFAAQGTYAGDLEGLDDDEPTQPQAVLKETPVVYDVVTEKRPITLDHGKEEQCEEQCSVEAAQAKAKAAPVRRQLMLKKQGNYYLELTVLGFFLVYIIIAYTGSRANDKVAQAWAQQFAAQGTLFDRNFSLIGMGEGADESQGLVTKESANIFKFYASGRRNCQGMLAAINLKARQDLLSLLINVLLPSEDVVDIEVYMHESTMPPMVLAVGTPRQIKWLQSNRQDVKKYTKLIKVANELNGKWNNQKMQVLTEHSSIFYDLFAEHRVAQIFTSPNYADQLRYFRYMHFTSENSEGSHKRVLRFQFALPPAADMKAINSLMNLVPLFIDLVGVYKMLPELKKKALDARAKTDAETAEEERKTRMEALQQRKMDKLKEEKEKLSRMNPEARAKAEEKLVRQAMKKQQKVKMVRM